MLQELVRHFGARENFAFETTLSGRGRLRAIAKWRAAGYQVNLMFLRLNIPEFVLRRRFDTGWENFQRHDSPAVNFWCSMTTRVSKQFPLIGVTTHEFKTH
jgi:hypothetical protein